MTTLSNNYYGTSGQPSAYPGGNGGDGSYALNIGGPKTGGGHYLPSGTYVIGASVEIRGGSGGAGNYGINGGDGGGGGVGVTLSSAALTNGGSINGGLGGYGFYGAFLGGSGGVGGEGIALSSGTLTNQGSINGGAGGSGGQGGPYPKPGGGGGGGGGGGAAVYQSSGTLTNYGSINGGAGGTGGYGGDATRDGGNGGGGGVGVILLSGTLGNQGMIIGGAGGIGGATREGTSGSGGTGGAGISMQGGALTNSDSIIGGEGASDGVVSPGNGGSCGVGGAGITLSSGTLTNYGNITGGAGGAGYAYSPSGVGGGTGGTGLALSSGMSMNYGHITGGVGGDGAYGFFSGGSGGAGGAGVTLSSGTLTNGGSITGSAGGSGGQGLNLYPVFGKGGAGGNGGAGVYLNGGTLMTSGKISGGVGGTGGSGSTNGVAGAAGDAVQFGSAAGTLVVDPGAVFNGQVAANGAVNDTLDLSGAQSGGSPITLGGQFTSFQTLGFEAGASWTVDVDSRAAPASGVTITGFSVLDVIDFTNLYASTVENNESGSNFTTGDGTFKFSGIPAGDHFVFSSANGGAGTDITLQPNPCYCRGTLIRTPAGDTPVEDLAIGDLVLSARGEARPVRWLGSRGVDCTRYPDPAVIWPIRIRASAFAENQPARDLWVSPGHSIFVDGMLFQAEKLVNGATIAQVPRARVEYWHVELDSHDILLAEGLPAESYLDNGNRSAFVNGGAFLEADPDFKPKHWNDTCVPLVLEGPALQKTKAALLARAQECGLEYQLTEDADAHLIVDGKRIEPLRLGEKRLAFTLPAAGSRIELHCRRYVPAQTRPASTDRRVLGLCVSRLQIDGTEIALDDADAFAQGWHALERNDEFQWRWSLDRTPLPRGTRLVVIDLGGAGLYWTKPATTVMALFG